MQRNAEVRNARRSWLKMREILENLFGLAGIVAFFGTLIGILKHTGGVAR